MNRSVVVSLVLAAAAGAGGYLVGSRPVPAGSSEEGAATEVEHLRARVASLERDLAARPTGLAAAPRAEPTAGAPSSAPAVGVVPVSSASDSTSTAPAGTGLVLDDVTTIDEFARRFMAFVEAQLLRGPAGHLEILKTIDEQLVRGKALKKLAGSEEDAVRIAYPALKFAVQHESQVVDLVETTFKTMAENPTAFSEYDGNTLEMFTEGLGMVLPGVIAPDRLGKFTGWAKQVLAAPEGTLPKAVEQQRRRLGKLLAVWAPPLTPTEALEKLRQPEGLTADELRSLLRRIPAEARAQVDAVAILGPIVEKGQWEAIRLLDLVPIPDRDLVALDRRVIAGPAGKDGNFIANYLQATKRTTWDQVRPFFDAWSPSADGNNVLNAVRRYRPSSAWLRDFAARSDLSENTRSQAEALIRSMEGGGK